MSAGPITMTPPIPHIPASTPAASPMAIKRITICQVEDGCSIRKIRVREMSPTLCRNPFLHCLEDLVGKDVDFVQRRVHVRRDSNSLELRMHDRRVHDPV